MKLGSVNSRPFLGGTLCLPCCLVLNANLSQLSIIWKESLHLAQTDQLVVVCGRLFWLLLGVGRLSPWWTTSFLVLKCIRKLSEHRPACQTASILLQRSCHASSDIKRFGGLFFSSLVGGNAMWNSKQTSPQIFALSSYFRFLNDGSWPGIVTWDKSIALPHWSENFLTLTKMKLEHYAVPSALVRAEVDFCGQLPKLRSSCLQTCLLRFSTFWTPYLWPCYRATHCHLTWLSESVFLWNKI